MNRLMSSVILLCFLCGCRSPQVVENGPSAQQVQQWVDSCRPRADELREKIRKIQSAIPKSGPLPRKKAAPDFSTTPMYNDETGQYSSSNTAIVPEEELSDFNAQNQFDLQFDYHLRKVMQVTASKEVNDFIESDFPSYCEQVAKLQYLVVIRTEEVTLPERTFQVVPQKTDPGDFFASPRPPASGFKSGKAKLRAFVADLPSGNILADVSVLGASSKRLEVPEDKMITVEAYLRNDLQRNTRSKLADALAEKTGGTFTMTSSLLFRN
jgi:hypothetical protein